MDGNNTNLGTVNGTMTLTDNATGTSVELPVIEGSIGPKVIDVRKLYAQTGYFTYDPGFMATAACRSSITYIDGDEGVRCIAAIRSRNWPPRATSSRSPTCCSTASCRTRSRRRSSSPTSRTIRWCTSSSRRSSRVPPGRAPDGGAVRRRRRAVGVLSRLDRLNDPYQRMIASHRLIAKLPTIGAMAYKYSLGQPFMYPKNSLGYAENFLNMTFAVPCESSRSARSSRGRWTASSSCTPTTSRTPRPRPCATPGRAAPTRSPASPPGSPRCGVRRMAAPTRPC